MKKIIILSDTHGNDAKVKEILTSYPHDYAILAGDYTTNDLNFINFNFDYVVRGNNDFDNNKDECYFKIENFTFYLCHGHLIGNYYQLNNYDYMKKIVLEKKVDVVIFGHTHINQIFYYEDLKKFAINPGSITFPRNGSKKSFILMQIDKNEIEIKIIEI